MSDVKIAVETDGFDEDDIVMVDISDLFNTSDVVLEEIVDDDSENVVMPTGVTMMDKNTKSVDISKDMI